jgi:acyl carrier protein
MPGGIEAEVRRVVARHMGVAARLLKPDVSLRDDLAGDPATVRDVVLAVERRLGVRVDARLLDEVRSYGELVTATLDAIRTRRRRLREESEEATSGRVRIEAPDGRVVERAGMLTPYALEGVCDDARRAGAGATVRVAVVESTTDEQVARLRERFVALERRGVVVQVVRRAETSRAAGRGA